MRAALAAGTSALLLAGAGVDKPASYLAARQQPDGGFAEVSGGSDPALTAWVVLGLSAAGRRPARLSAAGKSPADYLADKPYRTANDLALRILALRALQEPVAALANRLQRLRRDDGRIGPLVNSTAWGMVALRAAGRPAGRTSVRYLLRAQRRDGGWGWHPRVAADTNDTAAALQALHAAGIAGRSRAIRRGVAFLRRSQNRDGGFALIRGRDSDTQSTAWAVQGLLAAGSRPGRRAFAYLARMRRPDGSLRYSARYSITPVWVTAQALPALARKSFPLR